jgi:transcriptional regulator with XRE-family HTH domain
MGAFAESITQNSVLPSAERDAAMQQAAKGILPETEAADLQELAADDVAVSAEAAESFIENKRIGERIKYLRQRKHMGLVELGRHTGLSASFLSQLETGRVVPTLRNLARIAMVFSKDMSYFFEPERPELFRIVRAADRQRLPQTGSDDPGYYFESLGQVPADQPIAKVVRLSHIAMPETSSSLCSAVNSSYSTTARWKSWVMGTLSSLQPTQYIATTQSETRLVRR